MIKAGGWGDPAAEARERHFVLERLALQPESAWGLYERLFRWYKGLPETSEVDLGDDSADACAVENLLFEMQRAGLVEEHPEDVTYRLAEPA